MQKNYFLKKIVLFLPILVILVYIFSSIFIGKGELVHPEIQIRLPNFIDERPFLNKIFDINKHGANEYQARELSYFFDLLDANFIKLSAQMGFPHFYSLTYYISVMTIFSLSIFISKKYFGQKSLLVPVL